MVKNPLEDPIDFKPIVSEKRIDKLRKTLPPLQPKKQPIKESEGWSTENIVAAVGIGVAAIFGGIMFFWAMESYWWGPNRERENAIDESIEKLAGSVKQDKAAERRPSTIYKPHPVGRPRDKTLMFDVDSKIAEWNRGDNDINLELAGVTYKNGGLRQTTYVCKNTLIILGIIGDNKDPKAVTLLTPVAAVEEFPLAVSLLFMDCLYQTKATKVPYKQVDEWITDRKFHDNKKIELGRHVFVGFGVNKSDKGEFFHASIIASGSHEEIHRVVGVK